MSVSSFWLQVSGFSGFIELETLNFMLFLLINNSSDLKIKIGNDNCNDGIYQVEKAIWKIGQGSHSQNLCLCCTTGIPRYQNRCQCSGILQRSAEDLRL